MTKHMLMFLESVLSSTAHTARAVVLIVTIGLVTGGVPGVHLGDRNPADAVVQHQSTVR